MAQNSAVELFLALGIVVLAAKAAGYLSRILGQPAVLGELLIGIALGPSLLNVLGWPVFTDKHVGDTIQQIAELGVLLLLFSTGLEIHLKELRRVGRIALSGGALGQLISIVLVILVAFFARYELGVAVFVAMMLAPTSVSISAQAMHELGALRTREGIAVLGAAVIDDIIALILLSVLLAVGTTSDGLAGVLIVIARLTVFVVVAVATGWLVLPRLANLISNLPISSGVLAFAIVCALLVGWLAEAFGGMAAITGAFIAGVCLNRARSEVKREIEAGLHSLNYGLLVPIFFVNIGLQTDLRQITTAALPFALTLLAVAIIAKITGCGAGARLSGFDARSALRVGAGMVPRGEVGLIVGAAGVKYGLIPAAVFPQVILVILATAIITPPLVRWAFRQTGASESVTVAVGDN